MQNRIWMQAHVFIYPLIFLLMRCCCGDCLLPPWKMHNPHRGIAGTNFSWRDLPQKGFWWMTKVNIVPWVWSSLSSQFDLNAWESCMLLHLPALCIFGLHSQTNCVYQPQFGLVEKHSGLKNLGTVLVKQLFLTISQNLLRMLHLSLQQGLQQYGLQQQDNSMDYNSRDYNSRVYNSRLYNSRLYNRPFNTRVKETEGDPPPMSGSCSEQWHPSVHNPSSETALAGVSVFTTQLSSKQQQQHSMGMDTLTQVSSWYQQHSMDVNIHHKSYISIPTD